MAETTPPSPRPAARIPVASTGCECVGQGGRQASGRVPPVDSSSLPEDPGDEEDGDAQYVTLTGVPRPFALARIASQITAAR